MTSAAAPAVSVLVPCYNKRAFLGETLRSVYAQTLQEWELIVIDDGSTDGSTALLEAEAAREPRLRALFGPNRGVSAARQRLVEESRGRFVQYLDADDVLLPEALATRVAALERSGAGVAYSDWQRLVPAPAGGGFERGAVVARRVGDVNEDPELAVFGGFWSPPVAILYTRETTDAVGGWNESLPVIQDGRYLLDAAMAGARFEHVPGVSALYRDQLPDSLSARNRSAFLWDVFRNADQIHALWRERAPLTAERQQLFVACYEDVARSAFRLDRPLFEQCMQRLAGFPRGMQARWPRLAGGLTRRLGHRAAIGVLRLLGRLPELPPGGGRS